MQLPKLTGMAAMLLLLSACTPGSANQVIQQTPNHKIPPFKVSVYHAYRADECIDWFRNAVATLWDNGMDTLKVTTASPGIFAGVSDEAKEVIDRELSTCRLPKEICWSWIKYWNHDDSLHSHSWDMVVYECDPLLSDSVYNAIEDNSIDGYPQLIWKFKDAAKFAEITRNHIGRPLALAINGQIVMAPTVNSEIESGNCAVGAISREELIDLVSE